MARPGVANGRELHASRRLVAFGLLAVAALGGYVFIAHLSWFGLKPRTATGTLLAIFYDPVLGLFRYKIFTAAFWVAIVLTLCCERLIPAKADQETLSLGFAQDVVWFFYEAVLQAVIIGTYVSVLRSLYYDHVGFTITSLNQTPAWSRFLVAVLLLDLLYWVQHYCNHRVPLFWRFHTLHHSQKQVNFFTDFRYHPVEYIVRHTILVIPFLILTVEAPVIVAFTVFQRWYTRFYHGNIRTNLGLLRYVLVTPQSHRVHHSLDERHRESNFGSLFSVWDFIFRTQYTGFNEYPETGIEDESFPHETVVGLKSLLVTPVYQLVYPFVRMKPAASCTGSNRLPPRG